MKVVSVFIVYSVYLCTFVAHARYDRYDRFDRYDRSYRLSNDTPILRPRREEPHEHAYPPRGEHFDREVLPTQRRLEHDSEVTVARNDTSLASPVLSMPSFNGACWVAFGNFLLFALRPDPDVSWPARLPRIVWEFILWLNLRRTNTENLPSMFYVWLAFLTGSTGLADLFVWAPLYGAFVSFERCEGGWLQPKICHADPMKGYSRMLVVIQSVVGGMTYLHTAFQAAHVLHLRRVEHQRKQLEHLRMRYHRPVLPHPEYRRQT